MNVLTIFFVEEVPEASANQYKDNLKWIREAARHSLVVGSQARILYSDRKGRIRIAQAFNHAIKEGKIQVISFCDNFQDYIYTNNFN